MDMKFSRRWLGFIAAGVMAATWRVAEATTAQRAHRAWRGLPAPTDRPALPAHRAPPGRSTRPS